MRRTTIAVLTVIMTLTGAIAASAFGGFGDWSEAEDIESFVSGADEQFNVATVEICTFISPIGNRITHCTLDLTIPSDVAIAIDLLVARGFTRPEAQATAGTAVLGELRTRGITINNNFSLASVTGGV